MSFCFFLNCFQALNKCTHLSKHKVYILNLRKKWVRFFFIGRKLKKKKNWNELMCQEFTGQNKSMNQITNNSVIQWTSE